MHAQKNYSCKYEIVLILAKTLTPQIVFLIRASPASKNSRILGIDGCTSGMSCRSGFSLIL